ncbi:MAG TPA: 50S ribosomal protein L6 [Clostridia bacterium]|jgi:large subunit ribosomal protein L6|nr:50S ribosomal protein L6 [Clostridia bacterium]
MSRIGKLPITIPGGVTITVGDDNTVTVKGPKGQLSEKISSSIEIKEENAVLTVKRPSDSKEHRSLHGLSRTLINNMVVGTTAGFQKNLDIVGTGYKAQKQGNKLVLNVGYSHPVEFVEPDGITFEVPAPNKVIVKGINKQQVGQIAADIRAVREPEPYKGKGIKYDNEVVRRKEGKTGKTGK